MAQKDFGSDQFTVRIILEFLLIIVGLIVLGFLVINTILWETAQIFWILGAVSLISITVAFVIKGKAKTDIFDVAIAERPSIPFVSKINRKVLYIFFFILFLTTFFLLASSDYRIATPQFQVLNIGISGHVLLSIFAAIMEDVFFFVLMPGVIFSLVFLLIRYMKFSKGTAFIIGIIAIIALTPIIFMFYHLGVYGFENQAAMTFVYVFGLEMTIGMLLLKDITYVHARHIGNNLGLLIFQQMSLATFFTLIVTNMIFWGIIGLVIVIAFLRLRS